MTGAPPDESRDDAPTRIEGRESEELATQTAKVTLPRIETKTEATAAPSTQRTTVATPLETMHVEEVRRTRVYAFISIPFSFVVAGLLPFLGGDPIAKAVVAVGMLAVVVSSSVIAFQLREDKNYSIDRAFVFGCVCVLAGFAAIYYFGVFSPACAVIPFGLYFFSGGQSSRATLAIYSLCSLLELVLGVGLAFGFIRDHGLVQPTDLGAFQKLSIVALVEITYFVTFLIARKSRQAMMSAIEDHDKAVKGLAQREELLREARQDLEKALEAGGLGRFTDEVLGSFKLGAVIGRGGMGEVYEAVHVDTEEPAAVKLLHAHALTDGSNVRRFLREQRIVASLKSPHVVRVLEVGGLEARLPFIAMERLHGRDLADVLRQQRRLSLGKVVSMLREIGVGLEAAREAGVVHRDLKPRNLFLARLENEREVWKILDFGVSRIEGEGATMTREQMLGTPSYMAPEQVAGGATDHRTDLYALGVICYRALTGRPAFTGDQVAEILYKVVHTMPPRPSASGRLHADIDDVLAIAMAKLPGDRFGSALELAEALEAATKGELDAALKERAHRIGSVLDWSAG